LTTSEDGSAIVWSPKTQEALLRFDGTNYHHHPPVTVYSDPFFAAKINPRFHRDGVTSLGTNADGSLAVTGGVDGSLNLIHLKTGKV
jgi:hypothetical protein